MSLSVALSAANSGLQAAQASLNAISDNIANVNTPGYVRKVVDQQQLVVDGRGQGVQITGVRRVTDSYLQSASLTASSEASRWDAYSSYLDNAQSLFGNPSSADIDFFFNRPDQIYSAFASAADDPSSSLLRTQALSDVQELTGEANRINTQITMLGRAVDGQITDAVGQANALIAQIDKLNVDITRAKLVNADASGSENIQQALVTQLSAILQIKVSSREQGGVTVRSPEGVMLAGTGAATLTYNRTDSTRGYITATAAGVSSQPQAITVDSGQIRGLLDLRDNTLPGLADQLGEFVGRMTDQLNAASNASTAFPAPTSLTGRDTGLDLPTAISGFSGATTIAITNAAGVVQRRVAIDFTAGTMSVDGGAASAFTPATFLSSLNTGLGALGSATFTNGRLALAATGTNGVAIDAGTSMKAGKAFSHFFGLNDIVRTAGFSTYDTGLVGGDASGFTPGGDIVLRLAQADGKPVRDITVTMPAAGNMTALLATLNNATSGVGLYGQFSLDAQGALSFTGSPADTTLAVVSDNTQRGVGGPALSQLFGLGTTVRSSRAGSFSVDPLLTANPNRLALGKLDLTVAAGTPAISAGDGRGALAIAQAGASASLFQAAGTLGQVTMTVSNYAAQFSGGIGRDAQTAGSKKDSAAAVKSEADTRLQSVEGVNLDEELVRLTTFQQAYSASARMIQASKDLFDVLLGMI